MKALGFVVGVIACLFAAMTCNGCAPGVEPMPDAGTDRACHVICAWEDTDPGNLPAGRCPGATFEDCVEECNVPVAAGSYCPSP